MDTSTQALDDAMARAKKVAPNEGFRGLREKMARSAPTAIDYIEQAPVLVLAASFGKTTHRQYEQNYIAGQFGQKCRRGLKLREMMQEYNVAFQLRALRGACIVPSRVVAVFSISKCYGMHPSALAQSIPDKPGRQIEWLRLIQAWGEHMDRRRKPFSYGLEWIVTRAGEAVDERFVDASDLADFYIADPACFNPKWTFRQAKAACERWHRMLAKRQGEAEFFKAHGVGFSEPINYDPLPLEVAVGNLRFVALDSGEELFAEGAAMHHCVGTYSRDVIAGRSRIFSARSGERRVATIELRPMSRCWSVVQVKGPCNSRPLKQTVEAVESFIAVLPKPEAKTA